MLPAARHGRWTDCCRGTADGCKRSTRPGQSRFYPGSGPAPSGSRILRGTPGPRHSPAPRPAPSDAQLFQPGGLLGGQAAGLFPGLDLSLQLQPAAQPKAGFRGKAAGQLIDIPFCGGLFGGCKGLLPLSVQLALQLAGRTDAGLVRLLQREPGAASLFRPLHQILCIAQARKRDVELHQRGGVPAERQCPGQHPAVVLFQPGGADQHGTRHSGQPRQPAGGADGDQHLRAPRRGSRKPHGHLLIPAVFHDGGFCVRAEEGFQIFRHPPHGSGVLTQDQLLALGQSLPQPGQRRAAFFHRAAKIGENFFAHARDARGVPLLHLDAEFFQRRLGGPEEHGIRGRRRDKAPGQRFRQRNGERARPLKHGFRQAAADRLVGVDEAQQLRLRAEPLQPADTLSTRKRRKLPRAIQDDAGRADLGQLQPALRCIVLTVDQLHPRRDLLADPFGFFQPHPAPGLPGHHPDHGRVRVSVDPRPDDPPAAASNGIEQRGFPFLLQLGVNGLRHPLIIFLPAEFDQFFFFLQIMESITIPSSVEEVGTESFLDAQADEIHIQRSTSPSTVNGSFNILDKNKCRIYVPKGALAAYHTATWDWLGFPYILEEGDKYFDVDFELTGLTVKPFQPEIAISGRSVSFILVPDSGSFLPDSIEVWYPTGLEPCEYDAKTGKVTIATVKGNLTIKAKAIGALLPDKDTDITIGKDSTYTDGSTTGSKFNGVIGNDEELTRVKSLKIDTEDGKVTGITFKSLIVGSGSSTSQSVTIAETSNIEITLDGNNNLGKVLNQGSTRLLLGENTLLDALVENEGVFIDETGLLDAVTGPAGLTIAQRPEKAPRIEIGSSTLLKVEASAEGEANLSYIWEKFDSENNSWKQVKPEVQRTKALSSLRSDVLSTNEDTQLEVSEAGKYRCLVSNTVNAVNSTLTAYSEVSIASSTPDPTVTFSVTLPSVEGAALSPLAGTYSVEAGDSFSFSLTLDTDYDQSTPMVKVGDKLIEPTSDGKYEIKNINSDITISITGIVKNATVGNAEVESNALKIWGSNGVLHIQSAHVSTAYLVTFGGQLYKAITLPVGETMITIPQGSYIIRIENQSYKIRF